MKRILLFLFLTAMHLNGMAQGWPANFDGVMLQGFYWDSYKDAKWTTLTAQADELSSYFKVIWVPNSGQTKEDQWNSPGNWGYENMGYMPVYWLKHNTCFGTQEELVDMISTFKAKGTDFIEDVVINHKNGLTNWADFPNESYTNPETGASYTITWADDMSNLWGICSNDELFSGGGLHDGVQYTCSSDASADEADNFDGCRDLDHTDGRVQNNVYAYLDFLINELGYEGFRYDMVKGYKGYYTGLYNAHAKPKYSVGEYWDGNYTNVVDGWINETARYNGTIQSAAFDFPLKDKLTQACNSGSWGILSDKGVAGDPNYSRYSVTFVDNHDTYREEYYRVNNNVLAANAFILAMPGTPCIFLPHWKQYKSDIKKMIAARKAAGITNQSEIEEQYEVKSNGETIGYYLKVHSSTGAVLVTLGNLLGQDINTTGFTLVTSGENFAYYVSTNVYDEDTYEAIDEENAHDINIYVRNNGQGQPYLYVWNGGKTYNGGWPGNKLTEVVTLADGSSWYKKTVRAGVVGAIVSFEGDGNQSNDITNITDEAYICYWKGNDKISADYSPYYRGDGNSNFIYAYFDAPSGWDKAWAWATKYYNIADKNYTGGSWPGATMQKVGSSSTGNDIYRWSTNFSFNEGVPNSIIFSGNGQTETLPFVNGAYYDQNGIASQERLYFEPIVLRGCSTLTSVNWNGERTIIANGNASTTMTHSVYYPAGTYTVQAIVRGTDRTQVNLNVNQKGETDGAAEASVAVTGVTNGASSSVTTGGMVDEAYLGRNNGWHKVQATYELAEDGVLLITLTSNAQAWHVGGITIIRDADVQDNYRTTGTTAVTETNVDVRGATKFSFYDRGVNKNALITASSGQDVEALPCNVIVDNQCTRLWLTDGAYDFSAPVSFTADMVTYDRTFTAGKKVTVCLPFEVTSEEMAQLGITAYSLIKVKDGIFYFSDVESMEANTPYVVEVAADGKPFYSLESRTVAKTENLDVTTDGVTFKGTMARTILNSGADNECYGYSNGSFVKVGSNVGINPFRAYIEAPASMGASIQTVFDSKLGITEVMNGKSADNVLYTPDGRRVNRQQGTSLPKGLYISNGKKFVVK